MKVGTISAKRQITLGKDLLDQCELKEHSKVFLVPTRDGILIKPVNSSIVDETAGSLYSVAQDRSKRGYETQDLMSKTKKRVARKLAK